jgi:hypothetical protein
MWHFDSVSYLPASIHELSRRTRERPAVSARAMVKTCILPAKAGDTTSVARRD